MISQTGWRPGNSTANSTHGPVESKVLLRCLCNKALAVVPVDLLDKGIEIVCPRCGRKNTFD